MPVVRAEQDGVKIRRNERRGQPVLRGRAVDADVGQLRAQPVRAQAVQRPGKIAFCHIMIRLVQMVVEVGKGIADGAPADHEEASFFLYQEKYNTS